MLFPCRRILRGTVYDVLTVTVRPDRLRTQFGSKIPIAFWIAKGCDELENGREIMNDGMIEGFTRCSLPGDGIQIDALVGGSGPPLLLIHGCPQTRVCWSQVALGLVDRFTLVIPDLRGYGRSDKPAGGGDHSAYSKRTMANDQIATMRALGFSRFAVAGHDRGARVAYRLALDHPEAVSQLAILDVVPTADVWAAFDADRAFKMWHWLFHAQESNLPERLIASDPEFYLRWTLEQQTTAGFKFDLSNMTDYIACLRDPSAVHAMCEDYRAGFGVDRAIDESERGSRRIEAPLLLLWGEQGTLATSDPLSIWRNWASDVTGQIVRCGHFIPEEASGEVTSAFRSFFKSH